jgi:hypothetical protein
MEQETRKLTPQGSPRYDRGMSEAGAATELLPGYKQEVIDSWAQDLANAQSSMEREGIWAAIKAGISKNQQKVKDLSDEEVKRITDEMEQRENKERRRTRVEKDMEEFVKAMSKEKRLMEGPSHPADVWFNSNKDGKWVKDKIVKENLRDKKEVEWAKIGWGEADRKIVVGKLKEKFKDQHAFTSDQIKNTIELFVATGKTAAEIAEDIDRTKLDYNLTDSEIQAARGSIEMAYAIKKRKWFSELHVDETYVQRFVLQEEFRAENEQDYQHTDPSNIEEIAWQVMHHYGHKTWGPNGTFPLLEMKVGYKYKYKKDENGKEILKNGEKVLDLKDGRPQLELKDGRPQIDPDKSKYYINQANFVRWARERMWNVYDVNNDVGDFVSAIDLPKTYGKMDFGRMFPEYSKYFASEDGVTNYWLMAQELIVESAGLGVMNQMSVTYNQEMRDPDKLQEAMGKMFASNVFTKETFRKNMLELMAIMPLNYEGHKPGELLENDGIFGSAMMEMFLVYYHLSDFEGLQGLLGHGSSFFTKDAYMWALQSVVEEKVAESSGETRPTILNAETQEYFAKAFDANGQVTTKENKLNFINLINFWGYKTNNEDAEYVVRRLLYKMVQEKYGRIVKKKKLDDEGHEMEVNGEPVWEDDTETLYITDPHTGKTEKKTIKKYGLTADIEGTKEDTWTLRMAWVAAKAMSRVFGAGMRNDTNAAGYDGMTKMHIVETYRNKMLNKNADESGNPYSIHQFKIMAMDMPNAIVTESFDYLRDPEGNILMKWDDESQTMKPVARAKTLLEVLMEMQSTMTAMSAEQKRLERELEEETNPEEKEKKRQALEVYMHNKNRKYQNKAGELSFKARAMSNYYDDHLMRANETWKIIMGADEMEFEKYITSDAYGGIQFDRHEFQKDVQHKWIHPIRYFLNTYPDVNYNQKVRMLDQAATIKAHYPIYREMPLGEAMFGHELLNREEFWLRDPKTGKPINMVDDKGRKMKGLYEIDYDKVNDKKILVWKQFFMTKLVADLWAHRAYHSHDKRFDINYYDNVLAAIESIPGELKSDEFSIRDQFISKSFFDEKDMKWMRTRAKVENYDLFVRAFFKDILLPDEKDEGIGLLLALSLFTRSIIKQGS